MTRDEYLQILRDNLTTMTEDEKDDAIRYYLEYFIDAGDDKAAMDEPGEPEMLAKRLCGADNDNGDFNTGNCNNGNINIENYNKNFTAENSGHTQDNGNTNDSDMWQKNSDFNYSDSEGNKKGKKSTGKIIALVCTSPIWVPLAFAVLMAALGVAIAAAAIVFTVYVVFAAFVVAGVASVAACVAAFTKSFADGLVLLGSGLFMFGIGIFAFFLGKQLVKGIRYIIRKLVKRS